MPTIPTVFKSIDSADVSEKEFKAFKRYVITITSGSGYEFFGAQHQKSTPALGTAIASDDPVNKNGTNQYMVWNHIDHRYYRHPYDPAKTFEHYNKRTTEKFLFLTASIISVPYFEMGEKIKPASVNVTDPSFHLYDDGNGNLRDSTIDSASFADKNKLVAYWTFNNEFRKLENNFGTIIKDQLIFQSNTFTPEKKSTMNSIEIQRGIITTGTGGGKKAGLSGGFRETTSRIRTPHHEELNPGAGDNFAWSFWIQTGVSQSNTDTSYNNIISKRGTKVEEFYDTADDRIKTRDSNLQSSKWPYDIRINNHTTGVADNGKIKFIVQGSDKGSGANVVLTSTTQCTGSHHIVAQRSGSELQLWVNGVKEASSTQKVNANPKNNYDIMFSGKHDSSTFARYSGSLAEINYYKYGLSAGQISSLANADYTTCSAFQTSVAGNVFYKNGHIVISSPIPKYEGAMTASLVAGNNAILGYNGVHTIYENEVLVQVPAGDCNVSMNPSATYKPPEGNETSNDFISINGPGDLIRPEFISGAMKTYITTIGLYNNKSQLVAVGKLSQPIQKRDDIDMNFIVRWDY